MNLVIEALSKQYRSDFWGLRNFNLQSESGVIGLLGPNGAGKSTLLRIMATITKPTSGIVKWNGIDISKSPNELRTVLGYLPQDFGVYPNLNAIEFLEYMAAMKGISALDARRRIDNLLQVVNLVDAARRPLGKYSGGMKQRVGIAQALLNDPLLLIVDEPTVGLDPEERVRFRNLLSDLAGERIIILSTHIVSDVEAIATEIVVMNKGCKLEQSTPEKLIHSLQGKVWLWTVTSDQLVNLKRSHLVSGIIRQSDGMLARIISENPPDSEAQPADATLEDVYMYLVSTNGSRQ